MQHYVLTRAYRSPEYPIEANRRRVELLRRVTARSLATQGTPWTWIVYIDRTDPLLDERLDAFRSAGAPVLTTTGSLEGLIDWSGPVLTTRIDDDDAFARDAFVRLQRRLPRHRSVLMFPDGHRVHAGQVMPIRHGRNAWGSVYAPAGDRVHVRMEPHLHLSRLAPITYIDRKPGWLWVRHQDAETAFRRADQPITDEIRALYDVDWDFLEELT